MNTKKFLSVTKGRSLLCIFIDTLGGHQAALTNDLAQIRQINLQADLTSQTLPSVVGYLKARGLIIGGNGAFRADGRSQFGCRELVSRLTHTKSGQETHFPVFFWPSRQPDAVSLLEEFLQANASEQGSRDPL